jgi:helicase
MKAKLFPPQQAVLDHGIIHLGFSAVISLPTGTGKTTLAEMAMDRALAKGERVAYLTPLKSIAEVYVVKTFWTESSLV